MIGVLIIFLLSLTRVSVVDAPFAAKVALFELRFIMVGAGHCLVPRPLSSTLVTI